MNKYCLKDLVQIISELVEMEITITLEASLVKQDAVCE